MYKIVLSIIHLFIIVSLPIHGYTTEHKLVKDTHYEEIKKQAYNNNMQAQYEFASLHYDQDGLTVDELAIAFEYFTKAYKQGHIEAALALSSFYSYGDCVEIDHVKAYEIMKFAALREHGLANYFLAFMYKDGEGVEKDNVKALAHFILSHEFGENIAKFEIDSLTSKLSQEEIDKAIIYIDTILN